ncbi:Polyketide cyclase/dehydrase and lipid transport superfamily protein [Raphanus sativus]|nr:Polyketide cyclase/dehydrase and lipid transport superfamily protein [Raphanus sativus]
MLRWQSLLSQKAYGVTLCKMESALRKYIATSHRPQGSTVSAASLMKKIPLELENQTDDITNSSGTMHTVFLSRGHSALGAIAKIALAYFLTKLSKRGVPLSQTSQNAGI